MLIFVGIVFIVVENKRKGKESKTNSLAEITFMSAFLIGIFQLVSAVFPGTSRSGATIIGALTLGVSRTAAAEYTFLLAVPVMFGASALKLYKFGFNFSYAEISTLAIGMLTAFIVSIASIRFLMNYIKTRDFKLFGCYRIMLGVVVLAYFFLRNKL
jgi:undecaprenyl-diphosphatase